MMGVCHTNQKSHILQVQNKKFNIPSNNSNYQTKSNIYKKDWNKMPQDNRKKNLNKITNIPNIRGNRTDVPKKLIDNKGYYKDEKNYPNNSNNVNNKRIIRKKINLNPGLNKEDKAKLRNPSIGRPTIIRDNDKRQNNINIIREEINDQPLIPLYQPEIKQNINISNRNASEFNKVLKNNVFQKVEKKEKYISGAIGLLNIGNTCYFNSAVQNLKNVHLLTLYLLKIQNINRDGFTFKYCELISNLINQDTYQWFDPTSFFYKLNAITNKFNFGKQNDSNFCILYILSLLEKETKIYLGEKPFQKIIINNNNDFSVEEKNQFSVFMDKFYEKRNSCIIDIFYGFQEDIYKCNYCLNAATTFNFQGFSVLNIPIMKKNRIPIYTLEEGINYFQEIQNHVNENGFICNRCNRNNISTQSRIISYPKTLIINFKRVGEKNFYSHNVQIPMDFWVQNLVDGNYYEYTLIGFIKHYGGGNSGHNIAICNNFFDSIWYEFDDSKVTSIHNSSNIKGNQIDTSDGFLFFYMKKNLIANENEKNLIKILAKQFRK